MGITDEVLIKVIKSLKGKESVTAAIIQMGFTKGYHWAFGVLHCLEMNMIVSPPDKYGIRKILVDDDFFNSEFLVVNTKKSQ